MKEKLVNLCPTICIIVCMILLVLVMASIMLDNSILFSISFGSFVTAGVMTFIICISFTVYDLMKMCK